jgi:hypothetical protein
MTMPGVAQFSEPDMAIVSLPPNSNGTHSAQVRGELHRAGISFLACFRSEDPFAVGKFFDQGKAFAQKAAQRRNESAASDKASRGVRALGPEFRN